MSHKPKPCPFCGGEAGFGTLRFAKKLSADHDGPCGERHTVNCTMCMAGTSSSNGLGSSDTQEEAVAKWNRRADGWISCEDRLPEAGERVLTVRASTKPLNYQAIMRYHAGCAGLGFYSFSGTHMGNVTDWQPLLATPEHEDKPQEATG